MTQLIARRSLRYANRRVAMGESFEAAPQHARVLVAVNMATLAAETEKPTTPAGETLETSPPPKKKRGRPRKVRGDDHEPRKRTYKRRDMEAE
jgi:hypothetical protein